MALCNDVCDCTGNGILAIHKCLERVVITPAYFFNLLLMAVQQTFLRAAVCLPVRPQHSSPCALPACLYHGLYLVSTQNSNYTVHTMGKDQMPPLWDAWLSISQKNRASLEYKQSNKQKIKNLDLMELLGDTVMVGCGLQCFPKTRCLMSLIQPTTNHLPCYKFQSPQFQPYTKALPYYYWCFVARIEKMYLNKVTFHIPNTWNYYYTNNTQVSSPIRASHRGFQHVCLPHFPLIHLFIQAPGTDNPGYPTYAFSSVILKHQGAKQLSTHSQ